MKSSYVVRARRFANDLYPFVKDCKTVDEYALAVEKYNSVKHRAVKVFSGATRVVFVTSDYALKVDYGKKVDIFGGCENECRAYAKVYRDGFAYLFARISPVMVNERVFYIMPRVERIGAKYNGWDQAWEKVNNEESDYLDANFCDLHYENYGWKNGKPIIVDYAFFVGNGDNWRRHFSHMWS